MSLLPIFPLDGAFADVADADTAFGGRRSARFAFNMDAVALDPLGPAPVLRVPFCDVMPQARIPRRPAEPAR